MRTDEALALIEAADPLDDTELASWAASRHVDEVLAAPRVPTGAASRRRRARPVVWIIAATAAMGAGVAGVAASDLLGGPAPKRVQEHLAGVDAGMPADLRYNPDVAHAREVAATPSGALYLADLADGGYCLEVVSGGDRPRGAVCIPRARLATQPLEVTAPIPLSDQAALLVGGRATDARITRIQAHYRDGTVAPVAFGLDHAWLLEVPDAQRAAVLAAGLGIEGVDASGAVVVTSPVPALHDDDLLGTAYNAVQPIVVSTISDDKDFTLVLGIEGRVNTTGAVALALEYPDGTTSAIPLAADGSYTVTLPTDRRGDLTARPALLIARDSTGHVLATMPVASVAYWRAHGGG